MSCVEEIMNAATKAGIKVTKEEASEIEAQLNERLSKKVLAAEGQDQQVDLFKLAKEIATQAKIKVALERRSRLINAKIYTKLMTKISEYVDPKTGEKNPVLALQAILTGNIRVLDEGKASIDRRQQAIGNDFIRDLAVSLKNKDLEDIFKSGELDELIHKAMFDGADSIDPNISGAKDAIEIASIIKKVQKKILLRKNRAGAMVRELVNYVVRQGHDPVLMRRYGKKQWVNYMLERDAQGNYLRLSEKTFENKSALKGNKPYTDEDFMNDIYDNLVTGQHEKISSGESIDPLTGLGGTANLAKKMSQSRIIHFRDGQSSYDYARKFTRQSLADSVTNGFLHDGQSIGLMEGLGTNPENMFKRVLQDSKKVFKGDPKALEKFSDFSLTNQFKELDGSTRARGSGKLYFNIIDFAGINSAYRILQNMALLGGSVIASFSDIATKAAKLNAVSERGIFSSYAQSLGDLFKRHSKKDWQELALLLNVGAEHFLGTVHSRFGANDSLPGFAAKSQITYFKWNGMNWWNNAQKSGLAAILSADLAKYSNMAFNDIPIRTKLNLQRFGIKAEDWEIYRVMEKKAVDGRDYMVPTGVDSVDSNIIAQAALREANLTRKRKLKTVTDAEIEKYKDNLKTKLSMFFSDNADSAIPTPGARERALMNSGTQRGTVLGEALRALMQLKAFPITYVTKGMSEQYVAKQQAGKSGLFGLAQMMIGTTIMGYIAMTTKDILKGRSPSEVYSEEEGLNTKTFTRAFTQGGGAGIYGDFIFGEFNRFGRSPLETFAGPTFGTMSDILKLSASMREGNVDQVTKKSYQLLVNNMPYANLFYTKSALDYFFLYGISERLNPGYLDRMERRMQEELGQEFYIAPSEYAVRF